MIRYILLITLMSAPFFRINAGNAEGKDSLRFYQLKEVVVTGSRVETSRQNVPMTVTVITQDEIRQSGETNVLPALTQHVPGLFVTERGVTGFGVASNAAGQIYIRGAGGSPTRQALILVDGQPQYMGLFAHPLNDMYVASDFDKVEIIRGPASILYGSNAMGGAINLITKKPSQDGLSLNGQLMGGSYGTYKGVAGAGYKHDALSLYLSVNRNQSDGHRDNSEFKITNGYAKAGYQLTDHFALASDFSVAKFKAYDPGPASAPYAGHWIDIIRYRTSFGVENKFDTYEGAVKGYYNYGDHKIYDGFRSNDYMTGITAYQSLRLFPDNIITLGVDYKTFGGKAKNINTNARLVDTSRNEIGVYGFVQHTLFRKLTLNSGLRLEHNEGYGEEWIPQAGFAYAHTPNTVVKGSVSKGFRSPSIQEQFMFPPQNPDLKPERLVNYELGLIQRFMENKVNFELTIFHSKGNNLIRTQGPPPKNVNTGKFTVKGFEWSGRYQITDAAWVTSNYSYMDTKDPMLGTPKHKLFAGGTYQWYKFVLHMNGQYIDHLYTKVPAGTNKGWVEDYVLINGMLTFKAHRYFDVFIHAENLSDTRYTNLYDYPMPGTTVFFGINARY